MVARMERLMISIPKEMKSEIDVVKQQEFYDKPYAELYRYIIRLGLAKMKETSTGKRNPAGSRACGTGGEVGGR